MDAHALHASQPGAGSKQAEGIARKDQQDTAERSSRKNLAGMQADVSLCRQTITQLRGMLDELQRKQAEAIADMFKTVVFRLNGVKRVDSPSKQQ